RPFRPPGVTATDRRRSIYKRGTCVRDGHRRATATGAVAHIRNGFISFVARAKESKWNTPARSFVIGQKLARKPFFERDRADIDDEEHDLRVRRHWRDLGSELPCAV